MLYFIQKVREGRNKKMSKNGIKARLEKVEEILLNKYFFLKIYFYFFSKKC